MFVRTIDVDAYKVNEIIENNQRFISPFEEPYGYYIWSEKNENISGIFLEKYWKKLKYMSENMDILIQQAFRPEFYDFWGVDKNDIRSSDEMCRQLIIDSFVLYINEKNDCSAGCYLSNLRFMSGHYIDCLWDDSWNLIYSNIC